MQWSTWSECSANCGRGMVIRFTQCAKVRNGPLSKCEGDQYFTHTKNCNSWNKKTCPSPCEGYECMDFGACKDVSTDEDPAAVCECQMGKIFSDTGLECVDPPPATPTPRPIPTMAPAVKTVSTGMSKSASTILIIFVGITLALFAALRVFDPARVIQMNMEISLIMAHLVYLIPADYSMIWFCRMISILIHMFYTTTFVFMFLEALHTYSLVAFVVKKDGMMTRKQNVLTGWGTGIGVTFIVVSLQYKNYGGEYHCWLQMDTPLMIAQYVPIITLVVLTLTLIEAAGAADYRKLPGIDQKQQTSAKIMQRSNLIIMPMVLFSFIIGTMAEYEQNFGLYGTFTLINGILGGSIFFFHCTGNETVRAKLVKAYKTIIKKEKY
ncbi:adhesion G-protein coupled receptor D1 isoform X2 [Eurytemora carolleeae]|nr:adhesion G-protein coupled receptor D1 isoform X2 [Eurytemora carolleeae]XP_023330600.1 adhesion G-protein coupled receptor D1 isoform X2 [Eurytemora carolleeae]|eukprot:XP_023330599.1 adhesion G-protein coupled receptor D1-like isoform X2 [Eurytemora affinis]